MNCSIRTYQLQLTLKTKTKIIKLDNINSRIEFPVFPLAEKQEGGEEAGGIDLK